jgi:hypothetical protein
MNNMSSKTQVLVEIHKRTYEVWRRGRQASRVAEFIIGHGRDYDNGYDELITACNTFGSLTLAAFHAATEALKDEMLTTAESDAALAALLDAKGAEIDEEGKKVGDGYYTMSAEELRSAAAYVMASEFVEQSAGVPREEYSPH